MEIDDTRLEDLDYLDDGLACWHELCVGNLPQEAQTTVSLAPQSVICKGKHDLDLRDGFCKQRKYIIVWFTNHTSTFPDQAFFGCSSSLVIPAYFITFHPHSQHASSLGTFNSMFANKTHDIYIYNIYIYNIFI